MKYCNQCGSTMPDNVFFCANCGVALGGANLNNGYTQPDQPYQPPNRMPADVPLSGAYGVDRPGHLSQNSSMPSVGAENTAGYMPQPSVPPAMQNPNNGLPAPQTFSEFYDLVASKKTKSYYRWLGILCVLNALLNLVLAFAVPTSLVDVAVFVVLAVLLFTVKHPAVPIVLSVCGCISFVISVFLGSSPTGVVFLVMAIFSAVRLCKLMQAYRQYQQTGQFPLEQI